MTTTSCVRRWSTSSPSTESSSATESASVQAAEACLSQQGCRFDAIILDVGLPDGDGRDLCSRLRKQGHRMPIIMLTGLDARQTSSRPRLRARTTICQAVQARRPAGPPAGPASHFREQRGRGLHDRALHISAGREAAAGTGKEPPHPPDREGGGDPQVPLPRRHAVGGRQVLLNEVWGYNAAVTTHTLETHIYRLRQKIEPDPANARLLVTEGGGYRLDPEGIPPRARPPPPTRELRGAH